MEQDTHNISDLQERQLEGFRALASRLPDNPFYSHKYADIPVNPAEVTSMTSFRQIPFTTKSELSDNQCEFPPYGNNLSAPLTHYTRLHQTSGTSGAPLRWLDTPESWAWILSCWQDIYATAGITTEDRLFFPFSFGPFIGFWAAFEGASQKGCFCLAGGGMTTHARLEVILNHRITVVCCTPTYAIRLMQLAEEQQLDLQTSPVRALILAGEPGASIPNLRERLESGWGARVCDHTGMTEIGSLSVECEHSTANPHILEDHFIAEVVNPKTGEQVNDGEGGELVLTNLGRTDSPLIRYRTGDWVRLSKEPCGCGRTSARMLGGILGRIDDMVFIKGNNVYPGNIENIIRANDSIAEFRLVISEERGMNRMDIQLEPTPAHQKEVQNIAARIIEDIHDRYYFTVNVDCLPPGSLETFELKAKRLIDKRKEANS